MRSLRLVVKGLAIALLMGGFWGVGWGALTGGCVGCGVVNGITGGVVSFALLATAYVWLTRSSKGRLLVATGKIGLGLRRMLLVASVFGLMYSIAAYLVSDSIPLALLAGVAIGVGVFVVVPIIAWRVLKPELAL